MGKFDGKVVVVTGAGHGLGKAYALAFAKEGAKVVVNDLGGSRDGLGADRKAADLVVDEIRTSGGTAVANHDSVASVAGGKAIIETAIEHFGRIDVLVNNAGILRDKSFLKMDESMWDIVIDVHLKGTFAVTQAAALYMKDQNYGRIISTTSYAGLKGNFGQTNYAAAKAGIYGMTLVWAQELGKHGITANAIAPMAKTRLTDDIAMIPDEMTVDHVVPMALFLASDLAANVNGRVFGVHGGQMLEYKMEMTPGVTKKDGNGLWTIEEISEKLDDISRPRGGAAASADTGSELSGAFEALKNNFKPEKAGTWKSIIHFKIAGGTNFTMKVEDKVCTVEQGLNGSPTCKVDSDVETILNIFNGELEAQKAFMAGKIKGDNIGDLMKFGTCFSFERKPGAPAKTAPTPAVPSESTGFNLKHFGATYTLQQPFAVTKELTIAYAKATNSDNPRYLNQGLPGGLVAPPIFPVRVMRDLLFDVLTDQKLNLNLLMLVHGEQDMRFHRHLKPGDLVTATANVFGVEKKDSGELIKVAVRQFVGDELTMDMVASFFVRSGKKRDGDKKSEAAAIHGKAAFTYPLHVTIDQAKRYSEASGDDNPIHLDDDTAKSAGLPAPILQGLCAMAMTTDAIVMKVAEGNPDRLKRIAVRFSKPVFPGNDLTVTAFGVTKSDHQVSLEFDVVNDKGDKVLTNGLAELVF